MSGPPYPLPPTWGKNATGLYKTGISPVGSLPAFQVEEPIISQYANSPVMDSFIYTLSAAFDYAGMWDSFYDHMMDVLSADGYGLDVWGRIVGVTRFLYIPVSVPYLGFAQADDPAVIMPFGYGIWYGGSAGLTQNYRLSDAAYLPIVLAKAALNITDCSIPATNAVLLSLFPNQGVCYVASGDLELTYTFEFALNPVQQAIVEQSGVLPAPPGVTVNYSYP